ncbi:hypothetical protein B0H11DRAFT_1921644 [Mycena galericulata]|nr:hypothetical protein B0H11DRAFT_1924115 [Mycena galericulata]KAJ7466746.1 hypothetical protein B0H11DRAFT_1921644 [Mycena galericulata]
MTFQLGNFGNPIRRGGGNFHVSAAAAIQELGSCQAGSCGACFVQMSIGIMLADPAYTQLSIASPPTIQQTGKRQFLVYIQCCGPTWLLYKKQTGTAPVYNTSNCTLHSHLHPSCCEFRESHRTPFRIPDPASDGQSSSGFAEIRLDTDSYCISDLSMRSVNVTSPMPEIFTSRAGLRGDLKIPAFTVSRRPKKGVKSRTGGSYMESLEHPRMRRWVRTQHVRTELGGYYAMSETGSIA